MPNELKQCPFCGGEAETVKGEVNEPIFWVSCKCCQCETIWFETAKEAIETWNRRYDNGNER